MVSLHLPSTGSLQSVLATTAKVFFPKKKSVHHSPVYNPKIKSKLLAKVCTVLCAQATEASLTLSPSYEPAALPTFQFLSAFTFPPNNGPLTPAPNSLHAPTLMTPKDISLETSLHLELPNTVTPCHIALVYLLFHSICLGNCHLLSFVFPLKC